MSFRRRKEISETDRTALIEEVRILIHRHGEIVFALLFGSMANSSPSGKYGDMDIAVFVTPDSLDTPDHVFSAKLEADIIQALSSRGVNFPPPEVVVLNNAPNYFQVAILKSDYVFLKGEEDVFTDFIEDVGAKSMANHHFRMESLREVAEG